jgi:hypothetical protein
MVPEQLITSSIRGRARFRVLLGHCDDVARGHRPLIVAGTEAAPGLRRGVHTPGFGLATKGVDGEVFLGALASSAPESWFSNMFGGSHMWSSALMSTISFICIVNSSLKWVTSASLAWLPLLPLLPLLPA